MVSVFQFPTLKWKLQTRKRAINRKNPGLVRTKRSTQNLANFARFLRTQIVDFEKISQFEKQMGFFICFDHFPKLPDPKNPFKKIPTFFVPNFLIQITKNRISKKN